MNDRVRALRGDEGETVAQALAAGEMLALALRWILGSANRSWADRPDSVCRIGHMSSAELTIPDRMLS